MKKKFKQLTSSLLAFSLAAAPVLGQLDVKLATAATATPTSSPHYESVHDPSIEVANDGTYYVFGSHIEAAKSTDLVNWTKFTNGYAKTNNVLFGTLSENNAKPFEWAGENDVDSKGGFSVWAPDVFWNPDYVNADGTKGTYMMYFCTTSTYCRSVIAFGVSQNIEGPYETVDTVVYSGFTKGDAYDNGSEINKNYVNTNIDELITDGTLDGFNDLWAGGSAYDTTYAPNAIDPTMFYDEDGKLWMTYGSWSGGIFVLEMDPATGKAKYPGKCSTTEDGMTVDSYFGTRIAGGYTKSGEGPYIVYDKGSDYYYLYVTYEGLAVDGGYNMRLFRSKNPDGPYLDAKGNNAVLPGKINHNDIGIKVMGNYNFSCLEKGYKSPGHNSALVDSDGERYLVYHTRFDNWGEVHQVRVHQQFINEEGWPVTAVFQNQGTKISETGYAKDAIIGDYEFINHGIEPDNANVRQAQSITLNADGTISGDITGTWTAKEGTYYMSAVIDDVTYSGVFFLQEDESAECKKVMTFTAIGTNNMTIWGVNKKAHTYTEAEIVERAAADVDTNLVLSSKTTTNLTLPTEGFMSSTITWTSSHPDIISAEGVVTRPAEATEVTLTAKITSGSTSVEKTYKTTVVSSTLTPDYRYDFETVNGSEVASSIEGSKAATLMGDAAVVNDGLIGNVLSIDNNNSSADNYLALPSDSFANLGDAGFTVSMWVKVDPSTFEEAALFEAHSSKSAVGYPLTGMQVNAAACYNSNEGSAESKVMLPPDMGIWTQYVYTVSKNGISTYTNGVLKTSSESNLSAALATSKLSAIDTVKVGFGSLLSSEKIAAAQIDNVEIYSVALSESDIVAKYDTEKAGYPTLTLSTSKSTIYAGGDKNTSANATVECNSELDYTVTYSSSNDSIATVNENGKITAKKQGKATITATVTVGDKTTELTKKITVKKAYLKITKKVSSLKAKKSAIFKVKGYGLKANSVKWTSSKPSVLKINKKTGKATAVKKGSAKVTATYKKFKVSCKVKVK